jgi:hypothetical protein
MGYRAETIEALSRAGFATSAELPEELDPALAEVRPAREIARRLMTLEVLFAHAGAPEEAMSSARLKAYVKRSDLEGEMSEEELELWQTDREGAQAEHGESIDWLLEELWPLAWALGYSRAPGIATGLIPDDVIQEIFYQFLPGLDGAVDSFAAKCELRSLGALLGEHDLLTCALAVATSEKSGRTLPAEFVPARDSDVLAARLRAARFCLTPDLDWEDA